MRKQTAAFAAIAVAVNVAALVIIGAGEREMIHAQLDAETDRVEQRFDDVMDGYGHSFSLLVQMVENQMAADPGADGMEAFLKRMDAPLLAIEGEAFDGLYLYYQGRYLYSWDTPYSVYEESGYVATERPWYQAAVAAQGEPAFSPPYLSYANDYVLSTIAQLQPDGETVVANDLKMGDIQKAAAAPERFEGGQVVIFDEGGTVIGSTDSSYLGGNLAASADEAEAAAREAREAAQGAFASDEERAKAAGKADAAEAFAAFRRGFEGGLAALRDQPGSAQAVELDGGSWYVSLRQEGGYGFLVMAPALSAWAATATTWLVPLLLVELLLVYVLMQASRWMKNRELKAAYVELGQMQRRLEIALAAAQKDAAIDDLTGMMNVRSFRKAVTSLLGEMGEGDRGIFIMLDGDRFKAVNDTYGHDAGDEAIKLSAQMIVGRIRTVDLASRLHGDEFAIFLSGTDDYEVAQRLVRDINDTIAREAERRGVPSISLSAGAVAAARGDGYLDLSKKADAALYRAKEGHSGGFARANA